MHKLPPETAASAPLPRVKVTWSSSGIPSVRWRAGLFGIYTVAPGFPEQGIALSVRGLLRWLLVLGAIGYVGAAGALTHWFGREAHNQIGFSDVLSWPVRGENMARLRGRMWLAQGRDALREKRWAQGVFLLRRGLERCPEDFDARFALARFYLLASDRGRALAILVEGLSHGRPPRPWLEATLGIAAAGEDWETTLAVLDRSLVQMHEPADRSEIDWLLAQKLAALTAVGRPSEALAAAEAAGDATGPTVKFARVNVLRALGQTNEAAAYLARWPVTGDLQTNVTLLRLRAQVQREAGRFDDMDRALAELRALDPTRPEPLAFAVEQRTRAGRGGAAALDDYLMRFGSTPENLHLVAAPLVEVPISDLVQRIALAAAERGYSTLPFRLQHAMALLREGRREEFVRVVAGISPPAASADQDTQFCLQWLQKLSAVLGRGSFDPGSELVEFMRTRAIGLPAHQITITALRGADHDATARAVLAVSRRLYAESPSLRKLQAEVDRSPAASGPTAVPPGPAGPPANATEDWSVFSQAVDRAIAATRWSDAHQLTQSARFVAPAPPWLNARESDLRWREILIAHGAQDASSFRLHLEQYLDGSEARAVTAMELAHKAHAAGDLSTGLIISRAVLKKSPDHPLAVSFLTQYLIPKKTKKG